MLPIFAEIRHLLVIHLWFAQLLSVELRNDFECNWITLQSIDNQWLHAAHSDVNIPILLLLLYYWQYFLCPRP